MAGRDEAGRGSLAAIDGDETEPPLEECSATFVLRGAKSLLYVRDVVLIHANAKSHSDLLRTLLEWSALDIGPNDGVDEHVTHSLAGRDVCRGGEDDV